MKQLIVVSLVVLVSLQAFGQFDPDYKKSSDKKVPADYEDPIDYFETATIGNFGLGLGMDYGGIGMHLEFLPVKSLGLFAALGYNFNGAGYNFGATFHILPAARVCPTLFGMYGYNAVIVVEGASDYNKTYFGPTLGTGVKFRSSSNNNFFAVELLIPSRSEEYKRDMDALQNNPGIEMTEAWPIAVSFGYHFSF